MSAMNRTWTGIRKTKIQQKRSHMTAKEKAQRIADTKSILQSLRETLEPVLKTAERLRERIHEVELDLSILRDTKIERVKELR